MAIRLVEYLRSLVRELAKLPDETEWVEFKCNNKQPKMIGGDCWIYRKAFANLQIFDHLM